MKRNPLVFFFFFIWDMEIKNTTHISLVTHFYCNTMHITTSPKNKTYISHPTLLQAFQINEWFSTSKTSKRLPLIDFNVCKSFASRNKFTMFFRNENFCRIELSDLTFSCILILNNSKIQFKKKLSSLHVIYIWFSHL